MILLLIEEEDIEFHVLSLEGELQAVFLLQYTEKHLVNPQHEEWKPHVNTSGA